MILKLDVFDDETDQAALPDAVALSLGRHGTGPTRLDRLTVLVGTFFIWTVFGIVAFALSVAPVEIEMAFAS